MAIKEKLKTCNPLVVLLIVTVIALITAISVLMILRLLGGETKRKVCMTPECLHLAHQLHNWGDPAVDPCVDFYKATCGKFASDVISGNPKMGYKQFINEKMVSDFLRKNTPSDSPSDNNLKVIYQKCLSLKDQKTFSSDRTLSAKEIMKNIKQIADWPAANPQWNDAGFDLKKMLVQMAELTVPDVGVFSFVAKGRKLHILGPVHKFFTSDTLRERIDFILKTDGITSTSLDQDINDVLALSAKMNELQTLKTDGSISYAELKKNVPSVAFESIIGAFVDMKRFGWEKVEKKIEVFNCDLFLGQNLENILNQASKRTLTNMIIFKYIALQPPDIFEMTGAKCDEFSIKGLPQSALLVYVRRHFDTVNLGLISDMVVAFKESYLDMFKKSDWLSDQARSKAIQKLDKMRKMIGYPKDWETNLNELHRQVKMQPTDSLFKTASNVARIRMESLVKTIVTDSLFDIDDDLLEGNANYMPSLNRLLTLVTIMTDQMFDSTFPTFAKIGGLGAVIGHEIGHGFDNGGIDYDHEGTLKKDYWGADTKKYMQKAQCFVERFNNYDDPTHGKKLNGTTTLGEMLADHLGYNNAWDTYKRLSTPEDEDVLGFEGTSHDEMFFRALALNWCADPRDRYTLAERLKEVHPPHRYRVNGPILNMKQFAETFKCPEGSPMNPTKKCDLF